VLLGGRPFETLIDSGLIDAAGVIGFSIDALAYDSMKKAGVFSDIQFNPRMTADGKISLRECGSLDARLFNPQTQTAIGPVAHVYVYPGIPGVPDRVGLAFFHQLKGCKCSGTWTSERGASTIREAFGVA
jgi:hypothetical protein